MRKGISFMEYFISRFNAPVVYTTSACQLFYKRMFRMSSLNVSCSFLKRNILLPKYCKYVFP